MSLLSSRTALVHKSAYFVAVPGNARSGKESCTRFERVLEAWRRAEVEKTLAGSEGTESRAFAAAGTLTASASRSPNAGITGWDSSASAFTLTKNSWRGMRRESPHNTEIKAMSINHVTKFWSK